MKMIVFAGMIFSLSTLLKICSVILLCSLNMHSLEGEHEHHEMVLKQKKATQTSDQPLV